MAESQEPEGQSRCTSERIAESGPILELFAKLPARYGGLAARGAPLFRAQHPRGQVAVPDDLQPASIPECEALSLPIGDNVYADVQVEPGEQAHRVYATEALAEQLFGVVPGTRVCCEAQCAFGLTDEERSTDATGTYLVKIPVAGLVVRKLLNQEA